MERITPSYFRSHGSILGAMLSRPSHRQQDTFQDVLGRESMWIRRNHYDCAEWDAMGVEATLKEHSGTRNRGMAFIYMGPHAFVATI